EQNVRVTYLTNGMNWNANYILTASPDWKSANLAARASINNQSGADYPHASIQLIAGQVRRVNEGGPVVAGSGGGMFAGMAGAARMASVAPVPSMAFSGYHIYSLPGRFDLPNRALKQLPLFSAANVKISRNYEVDGQNYFVQGPSPAGTFRQPVRLRAEFKNSKASSLGMPLPPGIVRVYQADASGRPQLVGEDMMQGTAEGESVTLDLGNAFDVVAETKQTDYKQLGPTEAESSYEMTLRNHQDQAIQVTVKQHFTGDWQILSSSLPYKKTDSTTAQFIVPVLAKGGAVLKYRLRVQWGR
ncbi:MAG: DUF4139 domain-containing protein, partial [Acidobacteriota bacterium]|nr:DUF4139 domain-containing protein [Acidobacteriota bacterium]